MKNMVRQSVSQRLDSVVEAIVSGLHSFDTKNPDDVAYEQQQSRLLASYGDRSCRAGH